MNIIAETEEEVAADTRLEASELSQTIQEVYDYIVGMSITLGLVVGGGGDYIIGMSISLGLVWQ